MHRLSRIIALAVMLLARTSSWSAEADSRRADNPFGEQVAVWRLHEARIVINAPPAERFGQARPTRIVLYALPNGNTIEQTIGCRANPQQDWHFDIQHIGAQTRLLREIQPDINIVVAYLEAEGLSWPAWRQKRAASPGLIREMVEQVIARAPGRDKRLTLAAHSGGGSFIWAYLDGGDAIQEMIERIVLLDANYSYSDESHHGEKLLAWLKADRSRVLVVIAYDDRDVMLNGRPVVSATGGTYRASHRMIDRFARDVTFESTDDQTWQRRSAMNGQVRFLIHRNPHRKILHTALVGEMNGFVHARTLNTPHENTWGTFGGPRAYEKWIQSAPVDLAQASGATSHASAAPSQALAATAPSQRMGGGEFMRSIADWPLEQREAAIVREVVRGNVPNFLRSFVTIRAQAVAADGKEHRIEFKVMPDYLSVGSDDDFARVPLTPSAAQRIADALDCSLPTRKMVDAIYAAAEVKLDPRPMTDRRQAIETFIQHNAIIEGQRAGKRAGALVAGIKKDLVISNRLNDKPDRVAIYGWHRLDGTPIQPLSTVHDSRYVDYSHGVRLVKRQVLVDEKPMMIEQVLRDPNLCALLSDEGVIDQPRYPSRP
ncbi:hypothetical protein [Fontivita pretiosa]|uniref:hypothetical protein n=1 Tax=Fontivita pretiosa TaxID=2989684 RepID=UPI003D167C9A